MKGIIETLPSLKQREATGVREGSGKGEAIKKQAKGETQKEIRIRVTSVKEDKV